MNCKSLFCCVGLISLRLASLLNSEKVLSFPLQSKPKQDGEFLYGSFPDNFLWGLGTSAYQIEGGNIASCLSFEICKLLFLMFIFEFSTAWNTYNKGPNIWDTFAHRINSPIVDGSTADVACDSYHKYKEDVQLLKTMGVSVITL